ncbi:MAG: DUF4340 domain-containing protein, partial [Planctomycetia bacterium]
MSDSIKTSIYVGFALVALGLAALTRPGANQRAGVVEEVGQPLFAALKEPDQATALEVVEFDEKLGQMKPFRVQLKDGRWTIPSHNNYPADAKDRLARTAGAVIGLSKDSFVSNDPSAFAEYGVVDPMKEGAGTKGWGTRVSLFDKGGSKIADLIVGKNVAEKTGFKYMRLPESDAVYEVEAKDLDLSINFADWIDTDLLTLSAFDMESLALKDYRVNIEKRVIEQGEDSELTKDVESNWVLKGLKENQETNKEKVNDVVTALTGIKIVGVREKPAGMTPDLRAP